MPVHGPRLTGHRKTTEGPLVLAPGASDGRGLEAGGYGPEARKAAGIFVSYYESGVRRLDLLEASPGSARPLAFRWPRSSASLRGGSGTRASPGTQRLVETAD